ncbi:MAG TPA: DUF2203 domain-containing protein [Acidimicrobiia bacterium]|nr:DUF2203 domain-containing protein [Acidimicrobiia bacterium]
MTERVFSLDEARAVLDELRGQIAEVVELRADLTVAVAAHEHGDESTPLADLKGMEARLSEVLDGFRARGLEVKGWAPLLLDFPMEPDGAVLLCWLEGEDAIGWYHEAAHGFAGRRPLDRRHE